MKIRTGFVSNSSTSSFLITYDANGFDVCQHCGRSDSDPIKVTENSSRSHVQWSTIDDGEIDGLKDFYEDQREEENRLQSELQRTRRHTTEHYWGQEDREYFTEELEKVRSLTCLVKEQVSEGKTVALLDVDQHDDLVNETLQKLFANKSVVLLEKGGY